MSEENSNNLPKRTERSYRLVKVQLSNGRVGAVDAMLRNITESGAGLKVQTQFMTREEVTVTIKDIVPFVATVRWFKLGQVGLEFAEPFDLSLLKFNKTHEAEGIYKSKDGYHVFTRFKAPTDFRRPGLKDRSGK